MNFIDAFRRAIEQSGLTPPTSIIPNQSKLTRFRAGPEHSKNGWYRLIVLDDKKGDEIAFGSFGCWKRVINQKWSSKQRDKFTSYDNARYKREQERIRQQAEEEARHAAMRAEKLWAKATAPNKAHPYLEAKGIKNAVGIRQHRDSLVIPVRLDGSITSLQFIGKDGGKLFISNGRTAGGYCSIAGRDDPKDHIVICEGYATGMSLYEALRVPVVCAFFAGNLPAVAQAIRGKYPDAKITIAADNDQWSKRPDGTAYNAGIEKAVEAAGKVKALMEYPRFDPKDEARPTDFNDMALRFGVSAVRAQFAGNPPDMRVNREAPPIDTLPAATQGEDWRARLKIGKKTTSGVSAPFDGKSKQNARLFLENHPMFRGIFGYNEFTNQMLIMRAPPWDKQPDKFVPRHVVAADYAMLCTYLEDVEITISKDWAYELADKVGRENSINPPREYFETLQWDGKPRLDTWLTYYLGADKQPPEYLKLVGRKWLTAGVARIFQPGCKFDSVLILEGSQGVGKSMALRTLATFNGVEYFSDSVGDLRNKDTLMTMQGKIIIEMAELASFKKSENEEIKGFISRQVDEYRPPYGRLVIHRPRYFILAGSTNEQDDGYLTDRTGNRRYWPVRCGERIDNDALKHDAQQLWAEAVHFYKTGERLYLENEDFAVATNEQKGRFTKEAWAERLKKKLLGKWETTLDDAAEMLELKPRDINNMTRRRIKDALIEIDWYETRRGGDRIWKSEAVKGKREEEIMEIIHEERDLL